MDSFIEPMLFMVTISFKNKHTKEIKSEICENLNLKITEVLTDSWHTALGLDLGC